MGGLPLRGAVRAEGPTLPRLIFPLTTQLPPSPLLPQTELTSPLLISPPSFPLSPLSSLDLGALFWGNWGGGDIMSGRALSSYCPPPSFSSPGS